MTCKYDIKSTVINMKQHLDVLLYVNLYTFIFNFLENSKVFLTFLLFFVGDAISLNAKDRLKTETMTEVDRPMKRGPSKSKR